MVLVCLVISQNHVIKGSCAFIGSNPSRYVTVLLSLVNLVSLVNGIKLPIDFGIPSC